MTENDVSEGMVLMIKGILNGIHHHLEFSPNFDQNAMKTAVDRFMEEDVGRRTHNELKTQFSTQEKCLNNFLEFIRKQDLS